MYERHSTQPVVIKGAINQTHLNYEQFISKFKMSANYWWNA